MPLFGPASIEKTDYNSFSKGKGDFSLRSVRVKDIVLTSNHPRFEEVGGWGGIGTIFFDGIKVGGLTNSSKTLVYAKPYFTNTKFYPLINEIVTILPGPDSYYHQEYEGRRDFVLYYLPPTNIWNTPHHNALPDPKIPNTLDKSKNYNEIEAGGVNRGQEDSSPIILGATFEEKNNITSLYSYEGDYIIEGRWGSSIRMGSTLQFPDVPNNWSETGKKGDPILILRNGNIFPTNETYIPTVEDINRDPSSIYLTSTQKIPFFASSFKTNSFGEKDTSISPPGEYEGNQIIINSGRLILNANEDGVLISAPNVIHLSTGEAIHLNSSNKIILDTGEVYLVSRQANQSAVLGEELVSLIRDILIPTLESLGSACSSASTPPLGGPVISLMGVGSTITSNASILRNRLQSILSKKVKLQ